MNSVASFPFSKEDEHSSSTIKLNVTKRRRLHFLPLPSFHPPPSMSLYSRYVNVAVVLLSSKDEGLSNYSRVNNEDIYITDVYRKRNLLLFGWEKVISPLPTIRTENRGI